MKSKFFVPFETAKILREKGYNGICDYYYTPDKQLYLGVTRVSNENLDYENNGTVAAPTYHEVLYWLDGKGIYITCYAPLSKPVGMYTISVFNSNKPDWGMCREIYTTREEALNDGILKALKML